VGAQKIGFDGWVLDPDSGDLERAGTRIRLQEQPLQVLMELIDSRGGVVTREQLISKLWPKGIVDFDTGSQHRDQKAARRAGGHCGYAALHRDASPTGLQIYRSG